MADKKATAFDPDPLLDYARKKELWLSYAPVGSNVEVMINMADDLALYQIHNPGKPLPADKIKAFEDFVLASPDVAKAAAGTLRDMKDDKEQKPQYKDEYTKAFDLMEKALDKVPQAQKDVPALPVEKWRPLTSKEMDTYWRPFDVPERASELMIKAADIIADPTISPEPKEGAKIGLHNLVKEYRIAAGDTVSALNVKHMIPANDDSAPHDAIIAGLIEGELDNVKEQQRLEKPQEKKRASAADTHEAAKALQANLAAEKQVRADSAAVVADVKFSSAHTTGM